VEEGIDLNRTLEIAEAIRPYGVTIAQHGISGTPFDKVGHFVSAGINKGNVGTLWQNIVLGLKMEQETGNAVIEGDSYVKEKDRGITEGLWRELVAWADDQGMSRKSGDYKKANKPFHDRIMALPEPVQERIVAETEEWACRYIKAFKAEGMADVLMETVSKRTDENAAPERKVLNPRNEFTREKALRLSQKESGKGDYSD
jgi:fructose-bisphosphate aldolase class II